MTNEQEYQNKEDKILTCAQVAQEFNTTTQTIREWILLGKIDPKGCFQIGKRGRWRIYRSALEKARIYARGQANDQSRGLTRSARWTVTDRYVLHDYLDALPNRTGELAVKPSFWKCVYRNGNKCALKDVDAETSECTGCLEFDHNGVDQIWSGS